MPQLKVMGAHMRDAIADSTQRLEQLVAQVMNEKEPEKCDELAAEIWQIVIERDRLRSALEIQQPSDQK